MEAWSLMRSRRPIAIISPCGRICLLSDVAYNQFEVDRKRFEKLVEQALARLPEQFRLKLTNVAIIIEDTPAEAHRSVAGKSLLLGLFHGIPLTEKSVSSTAFPDRIILYQKNIEAICSTDEDVRRQVRDTLLHEIGHYFGLSEDDLRNL